MPSWPWSPPTVAAAGCLLIVWFATVPMSQVSYVYGHCVVLRRGSDPSSTPYDICQDGTGIDRMNGDPFSG